MKRARFFCAAVFLVTGLEVIALPGSSPPSITISPKYAHITSSQSVIFSCNAPEQLLQCQFLRDGNVIDLSSGHDSHGADPSNVYYGSGLDLGECGVKMSHFSGGDSDGESYYIGCRVRTHTGGWIYDHADVFVSDTRRQLFFTSAATDDAVVLPGQSVSIDHSLISPTNYAISRCAVKVGGFDWVAVSNANKNESIQADYGDGLESEACSLQVDNITSDDNGLVVNRIDVESPRPSTAMFTSSIVVAKPPEPPALTSSSPQLSLGQVLNATCTVRNSRPVGHITWLLGNEVLRSDAVNDAPPQDAWEFTTDLKSITQSISRTVKVTDDKKDLVCQVQHMAIGGQGVMKSEAITIHVDFTKHTNDLTESNFVIGRPGVLQVSTTHKSHPTVSWTIGDITIAEDDTDAKQNYYVYKAKQENSGWSCMLFILSVSNKDMATTFILNSASDVLSEMYRVTITEYVPPTTTPCPPLVAPPDPLTNYYITLGCSVACNVLLIIFNVCFYFYIKKKWERVAKAKAAEESTGTTETDVEKPSETPVAPVAPAAAPPKRRRPDDYGFI